MNERRIQRIEQLIKARVAEVVEHELSEPRHGLVTITRVKVDRDMTKCLVYWSVYGDERMQTRNAAMLARAAGFVQRAVAKVLHTRTVPRLEFVFDEGIAGAARIEEILQELRDKSGPPNHGEADASEADASEPTA